MGEFFFTEMEMDAIGEISNICLGNSASTLSMLVRQTVDITPPRVEIIEKSEYSKNVSTKKVFVKVNYVEGVQGCSIFMLEEQDAKAQAQADIAEDGYWGVEQTSQRIIDFATALTGGDPSKVEEMREAFKKGYAMAEEKWGGELPEISKKTYEAVMKKFDDLAAQANGETTDTNVETTATDSVTTDTN